MTFAVSILLCIALIAVGAASPPPWRWVILALSILCLFLVIFGGIPIAHR